MLRKFFGVTIAIVMVSASVDAQIIERKPPQRSQVETSQSQKICQIIAEAIPEAATSLLKMEKAVSDVPWRVVIADLSGQLYRSRQARIS
jgi:hypothetical protein